MAASNSSIGSLSRSDSGPGASRYEPLEPGHHDFRLLLLRSGIGSSKIQCSLANAPFENGNGGKIVYWALSYTWGKSTQGRYIYVDDERVGVTDNLYDALLRLRHPWSSRWLWVDALCINQDDMAEREAQVQIMLNIFQRAERVIAWLGESGQGSAGAFKLIKSFIKFRNHTKTGDSGKPQSTPFIYSLGYFMRQKEWPAFWNLLERPYWTRMWILQELAAPGLKVDDDEPFLPCVIKCGGDEVSFHTLASMCSHFFGLRLQVDPVLMSEGVHTNQAVISYLQHGGVPPGLYMCQAVAECVFVRPRPTLRQLICMSHELKASEERDNIYALLGMVLESEQAGLRPNYQRLLGDILMDYVKHFVDRDYKLDALFSNRRDLGSLPPGMPSWVPEVRSGCEAVDLWDEQGYSHFKACGNKKADVEFISVDDEHGHAVPILRAKGAIIGTIKTVVGPNRARRVRRAEPMLNEDKIFYNRVFELAERFYTNSRTYELFWRTLILDVERNLKDGEFTTPASESLGEASVEAFGITQTSDGGGHDNSGENSPGVNRMIFHMECSTTNRTFFTVNGPTDLMMGVGPYSAQAGDVAVVLYGSDRCFLLRPKAYGDRYTVVGTAYVHGVMGGELLDAEDAEEVYFDLY